MQRRRQSGLTVVSLLVIFAVIALFVMVTLKLFPVYMEHFGVTSSLTSLEEERKALSKREIRDTVLKRFSINDVKSVGREQISIKQSGSIYEVTVAYEVRVPFAFNVDFLVSFRDQIEVPAS